MDLSKLFVGILSFGVYLSIAGASDAHQHEHHVAPEPAPLASQVERIDVLYRQNVLPLFQQKCFDCHSNQPRYPWYHWIPGVRQLIDSDIEEGRKHMDMSKGFPFQGEHPPKDALEKIAEEVNEGDMPPFLYKVGHWAWMNKEEKAVVSTWVKESLAILNEKAPQ